MRRTKEEAARTRADILQSAERLFIENGYEAVTLDDIAAASNVTRGAVAWHFKNKIGLLFAIREQTRAEFVALADRIDQGTVQPTLDLLREAVICLFSELGGNVHKRGMLRVMLLLELNLSGEQQNTCFQSDMCRSFARIIDAAVGGELRPPWTPSSASSALNATMRGLVQDWAYIESDLDLVSHGTEVIDALLSSWRTKPDLLTNPVNPS
jgi:TetR/AcrR family acrAB operon transcriptional repressor